MTFSYKYECFIVQIIIIFLCSSCYKTNPDKELAKQTDNEKEFSEVTTLIDTTSSRQVTLHLLTGDFNGDGNQDTVREGLFSLLQKQPIRRIPFAEMEGDLQPWICKLRPISYLKSKNLDSLVFNRNFCQVLGLDYLINVGDLDKNGTDEIAVVLNKADFTSVNSCQIYSFCLGKWNELYSFSIHEVITLEDQEKLGIGIPGYLEKHGHTWLYKDYTKEFNANSEKEAAQMHKLKIKRCEI